MATKYADKLNTIPLPETPSGKTVGIVGADIAGLACALKALQAGHKVTIVAGEGDAKHQSVVASLQNAGAVFVQGIDAAHCDAVIVTTKDKGAALNQPIEMVEAPSHNVADKLFCVDTGKAAKGTIQAIAEAFETMESVERFFNGEPFDWGRGLFTQKGAVKQFVVDDRVGSKAERQEPTEDQGLFDQKTAQEQAKRCHGCGRAFEKNHTCWFCLPCEIVCPQQALEVRIPYLVR